MVLSSSVAKDEGVDIRDKCMCISADASRVVAACTDGSIYIWDTASCDQIRVEDWVRSCEGVPEITAVCVNADGTFVASNISDGRIAAWTVYRNWAEAITGDFSDHANDHVSISICLSPAGDKLVSFARSLEVRVWSTETGQVLLSFRDDDNPQERNSSRLAVTVLLAVSPDGKFIASNCVDNWGLQVKLSCGMLTLASAFTSSGQVFTVAMS